MILGLTFFYVVKIISVNRSINIERVIQRTKYCNSDAMSTYFYVQNSYQGLEMWRKSDKTLRYCMLATIV